jgi:hypothetical protein
MAGFGVAWLIGSLVTYFVLGFLKNFYPAAWQLVFLKIFYPAVWQLVLWGMIYQTIFVTIIYYLSRTIRFDFLRHGLSLLILFVVFAFSGAVVWMLAAYPHWFDVHFFLLSGSALTWFVGLIVGSAVWIAALLIVFERRGLEQSFLSSRFFGFLRANLPGILLALLFFIAYFSLAVSYSLLLRDPTQNFDDNFYNGDPTSWMNRLAAPAAQLIDMRPVHPFAFLIVRPLTWLIALFLNGNTFHAALLLNAGAGALCVLLAWSIVRRWTNTAYALLFASVLGASIAHLLFSTYLETYIFSAAALIAFVLALQSGNKSLKALVPIGLLGFGITITNFIQTGILFLFTDFKLGKIFRYGVIVVASALALAFLQVRIYPTSQPFYNIAYMLAERRYSASSDTPERIYKRGFVMGRTITLFSMVGPRPLFFLKEVGCAFPCFQTYKPHYGADIINSYSGFGSGLARVWFAILLLALGLYLWKLFKSRKSVALESALLLIILFNFVLHIFYGDDPMLYSPDWTYAVVLFVALGFKNFANTKWLQWAGLAFLVALMINNWTFLRAMLVAVAPYF